MLFLRTTLLQKILQIKIELESNKLKIKETCTVFLGSYLS